MARKRIIDLRDSSATPRNLPSSLHAEGPGRAIETAVLASEKNVLLQWSAPEYETLKLMPYWFVWPGTAALAFIILGIAVQSFFFVAFVVLAFIVVVMYAQRPPRQIQCTVSPKGIFIGRAFHNFSDIKSFAIFDAETAPELSLEVDRISTPYVRVPLGDMHPNRVRAILTDFLPEEKHKDFLTDQIARSFGF